MMNEKISSALKTDAETTDIPTEIQIESSDDTDNLKIHTTDKEIESFYIVKSILIDIIKAEDITYKDNERYFAIVYKGNIRKTICRINLDTKKKQILIPDDNKDFTRFYINSINDIYTYKDALKLAATRYLEE